MSREGWKNSSWKSGLERERNVQPKWKKIQRVREQAYSEKDEKRYEFA